MSVAWVGAGIAAVGVISQYTSAQDAKKAQERAAAASNDLLDKQFEETRADQAPFRNAGYAALARMQDLLGLSGNTGADGYGSLNQRFTGASLASDPGYQFELAQGRKALEGSAAARGGLYSGATLKALAQYGNDYAGTKFNEAWQRFNHDQDTTYNRLASQAGLGQTATTQVDQLGAQTAQAQAANLIGAGNARGAAAIAQGNAISDGLNQAGAWWLRYGQQQPNSGLNTGNSYYGQDGQRYANWEYGGQTYGVAD